MFNLGFTMEELMFPENYQFWNIEANYLVRIQFLRNQRFNYI